MTEEEKRDARLARQKLDQSIRDLQVLLKRAQDRSLKKQLRETIGSCWQKICVIDEMLEADAITKKM